MNIYIGNLSKEITDDDLRAEFSKYGEVKSAKVIKDVITGESKGFGFVEMPDNDGAAKAIEGLNQMDMKGKKIVVNEARPKTQHRSGGGGGHRSGGFGGNRGGGHGGHGGPGGGGFRGTRPGGRGDRGGGRH